MFLDEELENVYKESKGDLILLFDATTKRMPEPTECSVTDFINSLKQIDNSWRLFCKKHAELNINGFRQFVLLSDESNKLKNALGW